jgi:hypothetical protein
MSPEPPANFNIERDIPFRTATTGVEVANANCRAGVRMHLEPKLQLTGQDLCELVRVDVPLPPCNGVTKHDERFVSHHTLPTFIS